MIRGNVYHRQMNDQDSDAQGRRSGARGGQAQNWVGRGKVQALMSGDELNLRVDALTTQSRRFKALIGNGRATMDNTHVDNLIDAHFLAAKALREKPEVVGGQAYFINDDEQVNGLVWFKPLVEALGEKFPRLTLPAPMMKMIGRGMELAHFFGGPEPTLTHRGIRNLTESSSFRIDKARRDLGYTPRFTRDNGFALLLPNARRFVDDLRGKAAA